MNHGYHYREQLGADAAGESLIDYLTSKYPHSTRDEWLERVRGGLVTVNEQLLPTEALLKAGQWLSWHRPAWQEPEVPLHYDVIHEDDTVLVVNKPSGLPTMAAGGYLENTLTHLVQQKDARWHAAHRLGRGTSGLVLFCKDATTQAAMQAQWPHVEKRYLAVATGHPTPQHIAVRIGRVPSQRLGLLWAASPEGRRAESVVEAADPRGSDSLATVRLVTGRPHQIRIHLAAIGHPLVGDPLYLSGGAVTNALPGDLGYRLHAFSLTCRHPTTQAPCRWETSHPAW